MRSTKAMFKASLLSIVRDRQLVIGALAFPTIFLLAFAAFDIGLNGTDFEAGGGIDYYDFVVPGLLAMTAMEFAVFWTAGTYARLEETKVLRRLSATPIPSGAFVAGQVGARLIIVTLQAIVVLTVARLLGANVAGNSVWLVLMTVTAAATFLSLGFAIGARASGVESANMLSSIAVMPMVFLSGAFFPISGLPGWLESVMQLLPLAPLLEAMRIVAISGGSFSDFSDELLRVLVWVPVMFAVAVLAMRPRRHRVRVGQGEPQPVETTA